MQVVIESVMYENDLLFVEEFLSCNKKREKEDNTDVEHCSLMIGNAIKMYVYA